MDLPAHTFEFLARGWNHRTDAHIDDLNPSVHAIPKGIQHSLQVDGLIVPQNIQEDRHNLGHCIECDPPDLRSVGVRTDAPRYGPGSLCKIEELIHALAQGRTAPERPWVVREYIDNSDTHHTT